MGIISIFGVGNRFFNLRSIREYGVDALNDMEELQKQAPEPNRKMIIAGINLAVLVAYTIYFWAFDHESLIIFAEAGAIVIQLIICLILAIFVYRKAFLFSAALLAFALMFFVCFSIYLISREDSDR